jgi:hypothetical protein
MTRLRIPLLLNIIVTQSTAIIYYSVVTIRLYSNWLLQWLCYTFHNQNLMSYNFKDGQSLVAQN